MSLFRLALSNFKRSVREFGMLILSLTVSVCVLFNFQNVIYADSMDVLLEFNKDYIDMIMQAATVVFLVFLFFFIWYATNVFLNQRKKEIGIYIFMGLDNGRIGRMYALESILIGSFSLAAGLFCGIVFSKFFQMLLLKLSEISVDIQFSFSWKPLVVPSVTFAVIYGFMTMKGCYTLKTSSVLNLLSGSRQKEIKPEKKLVTAFRIITGIGILGAGYGFAWHTEGLDALNHALIAVVLVIAGVYLLYSGFIPAILRALTRNKNYLYKRERNLWVNSLAFRIKKNYRTYAMVTVLMICAVTVMAISIAMKQRYEKINYFGQVYSCQVISNESLNGEEIAEVIGQENQVEYWNEVSCLVLSPELLHTPYQEWAYMAAPYSQVKEAAERAGLEFEYKELKDSQVIQLSHEILLSLAGNDWDREVEIGQETYQVIAEDKTPYLGNMQNQATIYIVSDGLYEKLESEAAGGMNYYLYNYRIQDPENLDASKEYLGSLSQTEEEGGKFVGVMYSQSEQKDDSWIRIMYSLCLFMFATLMLACGTIIFMKVSNDVYEDKERYRVLEKLGIPREVLCRSVRKEISFAYYCPFLLMCVTSFFSVHALGNVMQEDLLRVNLWSAAAILGVFTVICLLSVKGAQRRLFMPGK